MNHAFQKKNPDFHSYGSTKPIILTFIGNFLPGYKAGGILRSMVNVIDHLSNDFTFMIVTTDRDLGDDKPYPNVKLNQWQSVGRVMVYYIPPKSHTIKNILKLIEQTNHDIVYLNSFFDQFTIKVLSIRKYRKLQFKPLIIAPRGEFAQASLRLKYPKKFIFIQLVKLFGLYDNLTWHASSEFEKADIIRVMRVGDRIIHTALDLPTKSISSDSNPLALNSKLNDVGLKIIFLSRISREKNLNYALNILSKVKAKVSFDIYGPKEDLKYWNECEKLISMLPTNIDVKYLGIVNPNNVIQVFNSYDLFLFPSGGENYGHVIAEALTSGIPVLTSDKTPWRNLNEKNFGWDISLNDMGLFIEVIEKYSSLNIEKRLQKRDLILSNISKYLLDPEILNENKHLFYKTISNK